jgi:hypothetical protein
MREVLMAKPMSAARLAEIRSECSRPTRVGYNITQELLAEIGRLHALRDGRIDYERVGAERERKATIAWLKLSAGKYSSLQELAAALERGEHLTGTRK